MDILCKYVHGRFGKRLRQMQLYDIFLLLYQDVISFLGRFNSSLRIRVQGLYAFRIGKIQYSCHAVDIAVLRDVEYLMSRMLVVCVHDICFHVGILTDIIKQLCPEKGQSCLNGCFISALRIHGQ